MKITLLSGGSGNEAILKALLTTFPKSDIKVILNAYDNGKSTGVCRYVTDTLGVSDIRKNHERMYRFTKNPAKNDGILRFYTERPDLDRSSPDKAIECLKSYRLSFGDILEPLIYKFYELIEGDESLTQENFKSFNLANMCYSVMYKEHGYEYTNKWFCDKIGIDDFVILNSFDNAYIGAHTDKSRMLDEGEIVDLASNDEKIVDTFYVNQLSGPCVPNYDATEFPQTLNAKAIDRILDSDIIIHSTGTFWSSIYPTFQYGDFYKYVNKSRAKKIWFVNTIEDKDSYGCGIDAFIEDYVKLGLDTTQWSLILNKDAVPSLSTCTKSEQVRSIAEFNCGNTNGKNDSESIKKALYAVLFMGHALVFDFDDTLCKRGTDMAKTECEALDLLGNEYNVEINSGNILRHIKDHMPSISKNILITGCGQTLDPNTATVKAPASIEIDGNTAVQVIQAINGEYGEHFVAITPTCIKYKRFYDRAERNDAWLKINKFVSKFDLIALKTGFGSIDIVSKNYCKLAAYPNYIYFSDELGGPDAMISSRAEAAYKMDSVEETWAIIESILKYEKTGTDTNILK